MKKHKLEVFLLIFKWETENHQNDESWMRILYLYIWFVDFGAVAAPKEKNNKKYPEKARNIFVLSLESIIPMSFFYFFFLFHWDCSFVIFSFVHRSNTMWRVWGGDPSVEKSYGCRSILHNFLISIQSEWLVQFCDCLGPACCWFLSFVSHDESKFLLFHRFLSTTILF